MADSSKNLVIGSMAAAGVVAVAAICDLVMGVPFGGEHTKMMDILFIICAGIVGYLAWSSYQELK
jgi:hypothetical protein